MGQGARRRVRPMRALVGDATRSSAARLLAIGRRDQRLQKNRSTDSASAGELVDYDPPPRHLNDALWEDL